MELKLKDHIYLYSNYEVEVWDSQVDVATPIYLWGEHIYKNNEDEHYLYELENIIFDLKIEKEYKDVCTINVFDLIKKHWKKLYTLYTDLPYEEVENDDEAIALCVEDVFTTISQGYDELAKKLVNRIKEVEK